MDPNETPETFDPAQDTCSECPARTVSLADFADILALMCAVHEVVECPPDVCAQIAHVWLHRRIEKNLRVDLAQVLEFYQQEIARKPLGQVLAEMSAGALLAQRDRERAEAAAMTPEEQEELLIRQGQALVAMDQAIKETGFEQ